MHLLGGVEHASEKERSLDQVNGYIVQGRTEPREPKAHPRQCRRYHLRCRCNNQNQLSEVRLDSFRLPVMVSAEEGQAKDEASSESKETKEVSGKKGRNGRYASMLDCIIISRVAIRGVRLSEYVVSRLLPIIA